MRAIAALGVAGLLAGQPGAPPRPATRVILMDVSATDARGRAVESLKPADFELRENGVPQTLQQIRFVKVDGRSAAGEALDPIRSEFDEQTQAAREDTRLFAIFLDEYHVSAGADSARVREALTAFVDRELGPRDLLVVLKPLDSLLTLRLTRDREAARHVIDAFEGRKGDYSPRSDFERSYIAGAPARLDQIRAQVVISALNALAVHLGALSDHRKAILLASEGFGTVRHRRGLEPLPTIDGVIRSANRYNVSIYTFDPAEPAAMEPGAAAEQTSADTLKSLAESTDGRGMTGTPTLEQDLQRVVSDLSAYYLLTYQSAHPNDGKFREVQIGVKKPGVTVRARKGYWALFPDEALAAEIVARVNHPPPPKPLEPAPHASPLIRPWFGLSRGAGGTTRITFVWEPVPRPAGDRSRRAEPARLQLKALRPDDTTAFEGDVRPSGPSTVGEPDVTQARAVFDVAPGRVRLRMAITDAGLQTLDHDVREITVRDLNGPVALGTPAFFRVRTAREFRAVDADPAAAPVATREFSRSERLIVRMSAYTPGGTTPQVTVKLMSRLGQVMRLLEVVPPSGAREQYQTDLPLAGLAPGEYLLEVSVSCQAGEVKDLVGFRVTS